MPDLVTHALVPYLLVKFFKKFDQTSLVVFICGTMLPDLVSRPFNYIFVRTFPLINDFTGPLHSPLMALLYCLLVSYFFAEPVRKKVFIYLLTGSWIHLGLDALQIHVGSGYYLFFPVSRWKQVQGLIWPEDSLWAVPLLIVIWMVITVGSRLKPGKP
jgi:hypothetical protein